MTSIASVSGLDVAAPAVAVRTKALGGQMAEPGWPTQALLLAAELDYRAGVVQRVLLRTHRIHNPTVREAVLHIPVGDTGLPGKVLEYTIHAAICSGLPEVVDPINEALVTLGVKSGVAQSTLLLMEGSTERRAAMIDAVRTRVAEGARVMTGQRGQPPLLNEARINDLYASYRGESNAMTAGIAQLGKADLLISDRPGERWVGVSLKSKRSAPEQHAGVALAVTADSTTERTEVVRTPGLTVVHLGNTSTLLAERVDALAGWRHAFDLFHGVAHGHPVGRRAQSIGRFLVDNEDAYASDLADQLWRAAGLSGRPDDIRWDDVTASTPEPMSADDAAALAGVQAGTNG